MEAGLGAGAEQRRFSIPAGDGRGKNDKEIARLLRNTGIGGRPERVDTQWWESGSWKR